VLVIPRPCKRAPQEKHSLTVLPYAEGKLNVVLADHHGHGAALGFQQIQGGQQIRSLENAIDRGNHTGQPRVSFAEST
jgi:hypothetical protein